MTIAWTGFITSATQPLSMSFLSTRQREAENRAATLRDAPDLDPLSLANVLYEAGQCALLRGQGDVALGWFSQAYQVMPSPLLRVAQIQAFHFNGEYRTMYTALTSLTDLLNGSSASETLVPPLIDAVRGLSALDHNRLAEARQNLAKAETGLRSAKLEYDRFLVQLAMVETLTRADQLVEAQSLLNKLDEEMKHSRHVWFRPEWYARQAHLLWVQGLHEATAKTARRGLGSVTDYSSARALSELYRLLALTLGQTPQDLEDARDARQRAVEAARAYSPRLELARALFTIGLHTKLNSTRTTDRARGSGYIYEAEQIYRQMDLPIPSATATSITLM